LVITIKFAKILNILITLCN